MSAWSNSAQWRPPQFGIFTPTEWVPFAAYLVPCATGILLAAVEKAAGGSVGWPQQLGQMAPLGGSLSATLIWSPVWGLPGFIASMVIRLILLSQGWFGWASALVAGAIGGIAVPLFMGPNYWLVGPLFGALAFWLQQVIYRGQFPDTFDAQPY